MAPIVEARAVHKVYDTGVVQVQALRGFDLAVEPGEMVAIMGPSGCGKTTLLNCLSGLDATGGGEVLIEGTVLSERDGRDSTSQETVAAAFPGRTQPTIHYFGLAPGVDPDATATRLESAFLENGLEAESIQQVVDDAVAANMTFNRLIQGFMGLGLLVGVAALGVISARALVERRQQIGVQQPSWENLMLHVPWLALLVVFVVVYAVALLATLAPAVRPSRTRPAEALRYQ